MTITKEKLRRMFRKITGTVLSDKQAEKALKKDYSEVQMLVINIAEMQQSVAGYMESFVKIDDEVVRLHQCGKCKGSLRYEGYKLAESYRAFAICDRCEQAFEF